MRECYIAQTQFIFKVLRSCFPFIKIAISRGFYFDLSDILMKKLFQIKKKEKIVKKLPGKFGRPPSICSDWGKGSILLNVPSSTSRNSGLKSRKFCRTSKSGSSKMASAKPVKEGARCSGPSLSWELMSGRGKLLGT